MKTIIVPTRSRSESVSRLKLLCLTLIVSTLAGCASDGSRSGKAALAGFNLCETDNFRIKEALCAGTLDRPGTDPNDFIATLEDRPGTDPNDTCGSKYGSKSSYTKALCSCRIEDAKLIARITYCDSTYSDDNDYNDCLDKVKNQASVSCP